MAYEPNSGRIGEAEDNDNREKAIYVLTKYYDAMNAHDVDAALCFLDEEVVVSFPEVQRNWNSLALAKEKFSGMFTRMPTFTGEFKVVEPCSQKQIENKTTSSSKGTSSDGIVINVKGKFACVATGMESERDMRYLVVGEKIKEIDHL